MLFHFPLTTVCYYMLAYKLLIQIITIKWIEVYSFNVGNCEERVWILWNNPTKQHYHLSIIFSSFYSVQHSDSHLYWCWLINMDFDLILLSFSYPQLFLFFLLLLFDPHFIYWSHCFFSFCLLLLPLVCPSINTSCPMASTTTAQPVPPTCIAMGGAWAQLQALPSHSFHHPPPLPPPRPPLVPGHAPPQPCCRTIPTTARWGPWWYLHQKSPAGRLVITSNLMSNTFPFSLCAVCSLHKFPRQF